MLIVEASTLPAPRVDPVASGGSKGGHQRRIDCQGRPEGCFTANDHRDPFDCSNAPVYHERPKSNFVRDFIVFKSPRYKSDARFTL